MREIICLLMARNVVKRVAKFFGHIVLLPIIICACTVRSAIEAGRVDVDFQDRMVMVSPLTAQMNCVLVQAKHRPPLPCMPSVQLAGWTHLDCAPRYRLPSLIPTLEAIHNSFLTKLRHLLGVSKRIFYTT